MNIKHTFYILLISLAYKDFTTAQCVKPYGLTTDLIEHTDRTWKDGFITNIPVWKVHNTKEKLQFPEIRSRFPSFGWIVQGDAPDIKQTAYRIIVSDSFGKADSLTGNVWDSNEVSGAQSTAVNYAGKALEPGKTYFWRVKSLTNVSKEGGWSDIKAFSTANELKDYAAASYPTVKSAEYPAHVGDINSDVKIVDFGKAAFGQLLLTLSSDVLMDTVIVHLGENIKEGRVDRNPGGTVRYRKYIIPLLQGIHTYRVINESDKRNTASAAVLMPNYIGEVFPFRYCEIEGYPKQMTKYAILREAVSYPFDYAAADFSCDNDTLNRIWELCKYSVKATSFAAIYIDGDRERIPYEADALINQLCHYSLDKEYSMARRTSEYLLKHPTWPAEWILQAVMIAWYDYLYTGDSRSLNANYDVLKARTLLSLREKNGLISTVTGLQSDDFKQSIRAGDNIRDIVDWPHTGILGLNKKEGGETDGFVFTDYNAVTNAYHYEALKLMSHIAKALHFDSEFVFFDNEAKTFKELYNKMFFNKQSRYYTDGAGEEHASLHANMFPLAFGLVPDEQKESVLKFIHSRGMACSVYGAQFLLEALYEANDADYALKMLTRTDDRGWYNMIRTASTITLEAWDNKYKPNLDWNHAWGAAPANIIPRKLLGVEPLSPAAAIVRIKPQIAALKRIKSVIPTIKGKITLEIMNDADVFNLSFSIPPNMEADVYLPLISRKYDVYADGKKIKTKAIKEISAVFAGRTGSGKHVFEIRKR
jgi:hypothetical protein